MITWKFYSWNELDTETLYAALALRVNVFIIEQNCPYPELDDKDRYAIHAVGLSPQKKCLAYARIFPAGKYFKEASIGRVCTQIDVRRTGIGKELMQQVLSYMDNHLPGPIRISAQSYLLTFYAGFGFKPEGDEYLEDGIPHRSMCRPSKTNKI